MKINTVTKTILLVSVLSFNSCVTNSFVNRNLNKHKYEINYISDSKKTDDKKNIFVILQVDTSNGLVNSTSVYNKSKYVVPAIIYTGWGNKKICKLGREAYRSSPTKVLKELFIKESIRTGDYYIDTISRNTDEYSLKIKIRKISMEGTFKSDGYCLYLFLAYSYGYGMSCSAAKTSLEVEYELIKNNNIILSESISSINSTQPISKVYNAETKLIKDFGISMSEGLSNCYKEVIESIILKINSNL